MKFLGLSPLAALLLAAVTTGVLIAMYLLKLRHRRKVIASSLLWNKVLERREERSLWEKLRRILSVVLAVAIGLLMVFAVARPEIPSLTGNSVRTLLVLDTSPSMLTHMSDGRTRWQHAAEIARSLVESGNSNSEFRIAGTSEQYDAPFTNDITQLRHTIDAMKPVPSSPRFPESNDVGVQAYFVSDGVAIPALPPGTRSIAVYDAARNIGITAFEVRSIPSRPLAYEAYLEVTNFGNEARPATINISEGGSGRFTREVQIKPGDSFREIFDLSRFEGGGIRASIQSPGDALPADDIAYTYLPLKKKTRALLVTKGNPYLQTALKLDSFVDLSVTDPKDYREDPAIDAYIFDNFAPEAQPSKPALILGVPNVRWLPRSSGNVESPSFTTWIENHPVMQYLSLHDVSITRASNIDASNIMALAASGQSPLIVASPPGATGGRWILLTFEIQASDFPVHESFPLFIDNVLAWFGRERLALRRTTGIVEVPLTNAQITGPDGKPVASRPYLDRTIFDAPEPGLYTAVKDGIRQHIAVNLISRQYSNVNHPSLNWQSESKPAPLFLKHEPWFYLLFLAVVLLGLEWFTYHRSITL